MKVHQLSTLLLVLQSFSSTSAFTPGTTKTHASPTFLKMQLNNHDVENKLPQKIMKEAKDVLSVGMMAALLWTSPIAMMDGVNHANNNNIMMENIRGTLVADAKEMASGSGSRVNKDAESLLRYGLPIKSKEVRNNQQRCFGTFILQ